MNRALVTAATSSVGKVIAKQLADEGYQLVLHYNTNKQLAEKLAQEFTADILQADLSSKDAVKGFLKDLANLPNFDVIINNAGVHFEGDINDIEAWEKVLRVNSIVPALIMGHANEVVNDNGVIINISSAYGHERFGNKDLAAYNASKAALNSLTRTFAKKLAPRIRVNAIAPGYVRSSWNEDYNTADKGRLASEQLIGKLVEPEQVSDLIIQVINNKAIDGEIIYVDGGLTLRTI